MVLPEMCRNFPLEISCTTTARNSFSRTSGAYNEYRHGWLVSWTTNWAASINEVNWPWKIASWCQWLGLTGLIHALWLLYFELVITLIPDMCQTLSTENDFECPIYQIPDCIVIPRASESCKEHLSKLCRVENGRRANEQGDASCHLPPPWPTKLGFKPLNFLMTNV